MPFDLMHVSYDYPDGTPGLRDINFSISEGESIALLGANGSGKSSLLRLLNGLQFATSGKLLFRSEAVTEASLKDPILHHHFRRSVGFVFQNADAQLFCPTVAEEIAFGPRQLGLTEEEVAERTRTTLQFLDISHLEARAPFRLSGGEKRKVAIASILSMNPSVLLFDEPFLGLDPRAQRWLVDTLWQLQLAGKTTIVATHSLELVPRIARTAIVLSEGHRLLAKGPTREILQDQDLLIEANLIGAEERVGRR